MINDIRRALSDTFTEDKIRIVLEGNSPYGTVISRNMQRHWHQEVIRS